MEDIIRFYHIFERLLDEDFIFVDPSVDFRSLCLAIGAPADKLDSYIFSEIGLSGDSVIDHYRAIWLDSIVAKYGVSFQKNYYLCPIRPTAYGQRTETKQ